VEHPIPLFPRKKKKTTKRQDPISDIDIDKKIINPLS
jgi:hypothetical protein